jgi:hypothetical protein
MSALTIILSWISLTLLSCAAVIKLRSIGRDDALEKVDE